jgi:hypothetical protein
MAKKDFMHIYLQNGCQKHGNWPWAEPVRERRIVQYRQDRDKNMTLTPPSPEKKFSTRCLIFLYPS